MLDKDLAEISNDSSLCEPSDGKRYNWQKLIDEIKIKERPLTEEEAERFRIVSDF